MGGLSLYAIPGDFIFIIALPPQITDKGFSCLDPLVSEDIPGSKTSTFFIFLYD